mmetsp:Transcript_2114/g.6364  ORF Transcript_2114/g.6364 Transcript_2114/m.6364 type:complete len:114 (-) Transcript_2114:61-402(-)
MRVSRALILGAIAAASSADALSQPSLAGRRAFLTKAATTAASIAVASPALAADQYSLDLDETYKKEPEKKSSSGGGSNIVGGALAGGVLLSLPFFAPNLARLAGYKNAKIKKP